ncbi:MAG: 2-hydroxyacid dehydrogenase [Opitutales bacterium]
MQVAVYSSKPYDERFLSEANTRADAGHELTFYKPPLDASTAPGAKDYEGICAFVNDELSRPVLEVLASGKTRLIALRCAGFNNVDLQAAQELGLTVVRVPAYSPHAVAEHVVALLLTLSRKTHRAYNRVREGNFALEGLLGFDLHGLTVGVVGTGQIGAIFARIMLRGFGCPVLAYDPYPNADLEKDGVRYAELSELFQQCDILSLHCPLTEDTRHLVDTEALAQMKDGVTLINTSRGALVDTEAALEALLSGKLGHLGLDVYEEESGLFFEDHSAHIIQDDVIMRLTTFPNVLITGHQAFFTSNALENIAETTVDNISAVAKGEDCANVVKPS